MVAGDQRAGVGAAGQGRPDGQPGADGLGEGHHVGGQAVVGAGQEGARAAAAALHLVRDHDGPGLGAELAGRGHVVRVQGLHAALPLDRLHDEGRGPLGEGRLQGADVVGLEELRGQALPERRAVGGVGRDRQAPEGAPVEAALQGHEVLALGAPGGGVVLARQLEGGLVGLGPGVGEEHGLHARQLAEALAELLPRAVAVEVGDVPEGARLARQGRGEAPEEDVREGRHWGSRRRRRGAKSHPRGVGRSHFVSSCVVHLTI